MCLLFLVIWILNWNLVRFLLEKRRLTAVLLCVCVCVSFELKSVEGSLVLRFIYRHSQTHTFDRTTLFRVIIWPYRLLLTQQTHETIQRSQQYRVIRNDCRGLTTCHTKYTWDRSRCFILFNITTLPVFVTYLTGALYVHPLWFYRVILNDYQSFNSLS